MDGCRAPAYDAYGVSAFEWVLLIFKELEGVIIHIFKIDSIWIFLRMREAATHKICIDKETRDDSSIGVNPVFYKIDMVINLFLCGVVVLDPLTNGSGDVV